MIEAIHFLLTYKCDRACDHCFVYGSPETEGTFTLSQIDGVLAELVRVETVKKVCFEGGEPFLFYPILEAGIRLARERGFGYGPGINDH